MKTKFAMLMLYACLQAEYHNHYGPMFKESWADKEQLHVGDPDIIETIMRAQTRFPDRPPIQAWRLYRQLTKKPLGLVTADKQEWLRLRNTLSKRLLQPRQVSYYATELNRITDDLITHIRRTRDDAGDAELANSLPHEMYRWSMECIGNVMFDQRLGCLEQCMPPRVEAFINAIQTMMASSINLIIYERLHYYLGTPLWKKHKAAWDQIFELGSTAT